MPIYYGCKNIEDTFNKNGIIQFNTIDELIQIINNLKPDDYYKRIGYMKEKIKIFTNIINYLIQIYLLNYMIIKKN